MNKTVSRKTNTLNEKAIRNILGSLLTFLAINALGGGYYGMAGAENVPLAWLEGSPFKSYFIPGIFLFLGIGGASIIAALMVFRHHRYARKAAFVCGILVLAWIAIQVSIIGYVSWMQPATAMAGCLILILTYFLPENYA
jgi:peptidoglycan/LPS O-acetylase OafA/YrhL